MTSTSSFFSRLLDVVAPRSCAVCGCRLTLSERFICVACNMNLPRTDFNGDFYKNEMAQRFWGRMPVERAFALVRHYPHADSANVIYQLKYGKKPLLGREMGEFIASELLPGGFFEGITAILPVPLARKRQRQRGYNQSMELARGVATVTRLPIIAKAVRRISFAKSQTELSHHDRNENVENAFEIVDPAALRGQHVLLIDDVVTTGATMVACGTQILLAGDVKISVLSWALAGSQI